MKHSTDGADLLRPAIKKEMVTAIHIFLILFSIVSYVADFVLDIILAINHFTDGNTWFFVQTVCSITVPALILTGFNIWWYKADAKKDSFKVSNKLLLLRILFIILLMAPLLRNFEALYYAIKSIKCRDAKGKETSYKRMISFITDAAMLSVFEAFMESGPQVVLQTCIFAQLQASNPNVFTVTEIWQMVSIFVSLFSMSAAFATYQRSLRLSLNDRGKLNIPTLLFLVIWRFFDITSRVIALGLFASVFPYYLIFICCAHFIAMFSWIRVMETDFCGNVIREFIYNLVLGEILIFFYFNAKDEPTRQRCTIYYILIFLENTALICVWYYYYSPGVDVQFRLPALILQFLSFLLAVVLMVTYYYFIHPTRGIIFQKSETELKTYEEDANGDGKENMKLNTKESAS